MCRLKFFYPLLGLLVSIVVVLVFYLITRKNLTWHQWLDAVAVGYILVFILSLKDTKDIVPHASCICGYGKIRKEDKINFPKAKGALMIGKKWNILITAVITLIAGIVKLYS